MVEEFNIALYGNLQTRLSLNVAAFVQAFNQIEPNTDVVAGLVRYQTQGLVHVHISRPLRYLPVLDTEVVEPGRRGDESLWWSFTSLSPDQLADGRVEV